MSKKHPFLFGQGRMLFAIGTYRPVASSVRFSAEYRRFCSFVLKSKYAKVRRLGDVFAHPLFDRFYILLIFNLLLRPVPAC
jgi:hypothetical protein